MRSLYVVTSENQSQELRYNHFITASELQWNLSFGTPLFKGHLHRDAKKINFTACHSGKLKLAFTGQTSFQLAPKAFWREELISPFFCYSNSSKNITFRSGKLKTEFTSPIAKSTSPIAKSTSPGLSDTTFFARYLHSVDTKFDPGKTSTYSLYLLPLLKGHLYTRERDTFSGTWNSIHGTPQQLKRGWPQRGLISLSVHLSQWWQLSET